MKRRDTIRSLYSATTEPTKLAAANPRPDHGADQGDQVSANAPDRAPPPEKLAMANFGTVSLLARPVGATACRPASTTHRSERIY